MFTGIMSLIIFLLFVAIAAVDEAEGRIFIAMLLLGSLYLYSFGADMKSRAKGYCTAAGELYISSDTVHVWCGKGAAGHKYSFVKSLTPCGEEASTSETNSEE